MNGVVLTLALTSIGMGAVAQVLLKLGMSGPGVRGAIESGGAWAVARSVAFSPGVLGGLALYFISTMFWLSVLSRAELSQAYPFVGLSFVLTAVMGYFLFHDAMTAWRVAGITLIVAGVVLVGRS